jgi:hypothetical protein
MPPLSIAKYSSRFWIVVTVSIVTIFIGIVRFPPDALDWYQVFKPAAQALAIGNNPYEIPRFFNPPWTVIPLIPIAFLPTGLDLWVLSLVTLIVLAVTTYLLGGNEIAIAAILFSLPAIFGLSNGNIDWLAVLGFVLPPSLGLFFVVIKPQIGFGVVVFWLFRSWERGGWLEVGRTFTPITVVTLLSFLIYGLWPLRTINVEPYGYAGFWPWSIPVGVILLGLAVWKREKVYAIGSSPWLAPHLEFHSWIGPLFALVRVPKILVAIVVAMWIVVVIVSLGGF